MIRFRVSGRRLEVFLTLGMAQIARSNQVVSLSCLCLTWQPSFNIIKTSRDPCYATVVNSIFVQINLNLVDTYSSLRESTKRATTLPTKGWQLKWPRVYVSLSTSYLYLCITRRSGALFYFK